MGIVRKLYVLVPCALVLFSSTGFSHAQDTIRSGQHAEAAKSGYIAVQDGHVFHKRFGKGDPVIVVHGGPGLDHGYLLPQMLELAQDHELIFYDQRGSGRSFEANIDPKYVSSEQFVQDLETLRVKLDLKKISLIGHSWGGFLSMNYAIQYPDHVSSLIIVGSVPADYAGQKAFVDEWNQRTQGIQDKIHPLFNSETLGALSKEKINQAYRDLFSVYFDNPASIEKLTLDMSKESAISGLKVLSLVSKTSYFTPRCNVIPQLSKLNVPTLIIHGNEDIVPINTAKAIQKAIPNSQIVCLDHCGHFPYIEKPNEFFSSIRLFLSQQN